MLRGLHHHRDQTDRHVERQFSFAAAYCFCNLKHGGGQKEQMIEIFFWEKYVGGKRGGREGDERHEQR